MNKPINLNYNDLENLPTEVIVELEKYDLAHQTAKFKYMSPTSEDLTETLARSKDFNGIGYHTIIKLDETQKNEPALSDLIAKIKKLPETAGVYIMQEHSNQEGLS